MTTDQLSDAVATQRPTFVCPPWCSGHDHDGQPDGRLLWTDDAESTAGNEPMRDHKGRLTGVDADVNVGMVYVERLVGSTSSVTLDGDAHLTPEDAEAVAAQLVEAAQRVRAFEASRS